MRRDEMMSPVVTGTCWWISHLRAIYKSYFGMILNPKTYFLSRSIKTFIVFCFIYIFVYFLLVHYSYVSHFPFLNTVISAFILLLVKCRCLIFSYLYSIITSNDNLNDREEISKEYKELMFPFNLING